MTELDEPIHLSAYDPQWPTLFASEALRIAARLPAQISEAKRAAFESGIRSLLAYSDYKSAVVARLVSQALGPH